ncbi:hypothetical protein GUITHDRAFT_122330 [Guillardia theta CCMP2712]|uniref:Uncharacterized protein n=1 Tax=Guillardia theta (strain CCMP2712) TaxID=905079 RepID=L1I5G3_GUITC|nr:hypothetical protein GUITHDRAFT_122330 [Guillardia theta CCMP2712]EKX31481.1 hypothetical protein GUITHDRAFT_122330 [Guillardia theta CCMP2712]|eukprot:XP_005818461.1 hypothetical protein GUITHDRAFT_122330 [Guillardia theta CCMP2712]
MRRPTAQGNVSMLVLPQHAGRDLCPVNMSDRMFDDNPAPRIWQVFPEGTPDIAPSTATGAIGMWSAHSAVFDLRLGSGKQVQAEEVMSVPGAMLLHDVRECRWEEKEMTEGKVLSREECAKAIILSEAMGYQEHDLLKVFRSCA